MDSLPIPSPDYTSLEASLKQFLKSKPELSDYDFEGSVLSTIVGLLAYNSTMNAFYLNQVANESFLETASRRSSVVMNAQDLGYEVGSKSSAFAIINLTLTTTSLTPASSLVIPADSAVFVASVNGRSFTFRSLEDVVLTLGGSTGAFFYSGDIVIYEGKKLSHTFTVTQAHIDNGYKIDNVDIDTNTIKVINKHSGGVVSYAYTHQHNIVNDLTDASLVYFVNDSYGYPNLQFGDGIIGRKLVIGDEITVSYLKTNGALANGIGAFSMPSLYLGMPSTIKVLAAASGGSDAESIDSIKYNAPKWFESQGRAVTAADYKVIATKLFRNIDDIIVWGGEDNDPPVYGKVFLAIKPYTGFYLTSVEKKAIVDGLKKYNVVTVQPEIIDPDYVFVDINGDFEYSGAATYHTDSSISSVVVNNLQAFATYNLGKFDADIRYSRISNVVLGADSSIQSTKLAFTLSKHVTPITGDYSDIYLTFGNPIKASTLASSKFTFNNYTSCKFVDNGVGGVHVINSTNNQVVLANAGTVDYSTGVVNITRVYLVSTDATLIESTGAVYVDFRASAADLDINTTQRNILVIDNIAMTAKRV